MRSIKLKLIIIIAVMILAAISIVTFPILNAQIRSSKDDITENATLQMTSAIKSINSFFDKPKTIVKDTSLYVKRGDFNLERAQKDFEDLIKGNSSILCLYYADPVPINKGGMFYSSDCWIPENDYDKDSRDWYAEAKKTDKAIVSEPYIDEDTHSLVTTVAYAVRENDKFLGVNGIDILLTDINSIVSENKLTKNGKTFLIDQKGLYLTNEDFDKIMKVNFFDEYKSLSKYKTNLNSKVFIDTDAAGGYYFAGQVVNKDLGWILVTVGHSKEIYTSLQKSVATTVTLALISLIVSILLAVIITSQMVKPIKRVDLAVNKIASGNADLTHRLETTSKDEIGNLVIGFNKFIEKLQRIVGDVKHSKNNLSSIETELQQSVEITASSITEILANIESIAGQIDQQSNSVIQTSAAVTEIAENINSLERMIENQSNGVSQASAAVEQMIGNISSVNTSVEQMAESFAAL
ncbi:MAG: methyl-accepting chemotaxis protein, partial [Spirochaetales bacterium]|nr:methyl-accepting chemotaxis protein [Spirochaetales bacterium]